MSAPALVAVLLVVGAAQAKSWCAAPVVVHEWGVQVFGGGEAQPQAVELPAWFHRLPESEGLRAAPVRDLPADGGERELPVLQVYAPRIYGDAVPLALEVGVAHGRPSAWFPQADRVSPARPAGDAGPQLAWDALVLTPRPRGATRPPSVPWIADLRAVDGALWVNRGDESERFLFYEASTEERPVVSLIGDRVTNRGAWAVHDLVVVRRGGSAPQVARLARLASGGTASLSFEPVADPGALLRPWLTERLLVSTTAGDLAAWSMDTDDCVMMRDPAVPSTRSDGHGLFQGEIDALLGFWQSRFFEQPGTVLLYRDDPAALDAMVPLAVYTDMHHFVSLSRTGLVLWEGLEPPGGPAE